jgi:ATP-binding cassette subfamily B protein
MANPYAAGASAGTIMANVKGDIGNNNDNPQGRLDETGLATAEVTRRLLAYTRPHRVSLIASFVASAVSVVLQLYVPIVIGRAIDCMVSAGDVDFAALVALLQELALVVVGAAVTQWLSGYCTNRLTYETVRDLRIDAFSRFRDLPLSFVDAHSHGDLLSRVVNDADQVGDGLLQGLTQLFTGVVTIVGTLVFMFSISVPVGLVVVIVTPVSMLVAWLIARYSAKSFKEQQALQGSLGGYVEEMVGSQKLVCAFAYGDRAQAGFDEINQRLLGVGEHAQFTSSLSNPATRVVNNITYAVVAVVGCICVISGWPSVLTVGQVQSFLSYANQYMKPFNEISHRGHAGPDSLRLGQASLRAHRCRGAQKRRCRRCPRCPRDPRGGALPSRTCELLLRPRCPLLQDIAFSAKPGHAIALVGPTGCGKTTLINLLLRFYDVDSGSDRGRRP